MQTIGSSRTTNFLCEAFLIFVHRDSQDERGGGTAQVLPSDDDVPDGEDVIDAGAYFGSGAGAGSSPPPGPAAAAVDHDEV